MTDKQLYRQWWGADCYLSYAPSPNTVLQYNASACPLIFSQYTATRAHCHKFNEQVPRLIKTFEVNAIVLSGRWGSLFKRGVRPVAVAVTVKHLKERGVEVYVLG